MSYTIDRHFDGANMEEIDTRTRKALADHGFGVLTEIDVQATLKKKLGAEMPGYVILGACSPKMARQVIEKEVRAGSMLPCNVILREVEGGVEVSAVDPVASMKAIDNAALGDVLDQVRDMLQKAVAEI